MFTQSPLHCLYNVLVNSSKSKHKNNYALLGFLAITFTISGQNIEKVDSLTRILNKSTVQDTTRIKAYNDLGVEYAISDPVLAKKYINKALVIAKRIKKHRGIAGAHNCLGIVYYYQKQYDAALVHFKKSLHINEKIGHSWGQASALNQIATVHNHLEDGYKAISYLNKAGILFLQSNDSISYAKSIENIGTSYHLLGILDKSVDHFIQAIEIYQKLDKDLEIARGNYQLGYILFFKKEYYKAISHLENALQSFQKEGNYRLIRSSHVRLGNCFKALKKYNKAITHYHTVLEIDNAKDNIMNNANVLVALSEIYYDIKDVKQSVFYQKRAIQELRSDKKTVNNIRTEVFTYTKLSKLYLQQKKNDSAALFAEKALEISRNNCLLKKEEEASLLLAQIAEQKGDSVAAYQYFKRLSILKDTIQNLENKKHVFELHTKYETKQKDQLIQKLEGHNQKTIKQQVLMAFGFLVCICLCGIGIFLFKRKLNVSVKEKKVLDTVLDHKNNELTTHAIHLAKKNQVLKDVKEEVEQISRSQGLATNQYRNVLQTIKFDQKEDQDWDNFKKYFGDIHKDFYANLKNTYPTLTPNELRLMALLKLNLSTREVANILSITQEGVRKARYRLRKKMNIKSNDDLIDIVLSV